MRQTWRWFGPNDTVTIDDLLQVGSTRTAASAVCQVAKEPRAPGQGNVCAVEIDQV